MEEAFNPRIDRQETARCVSRAWVPKRDGAAPKESGIGPSDIGCELVPRAIDGSRLPALRNLNLYGVADPLTLGLLSAPRESHAENQEKHLALHAYDPTKRRCGDPCLCGILRGAMSQESMELVYRSVEAINRRDLDAYLALVDHDIEAQCVPWKI
jgi:hypothetical protein